RRMHSDNHQAKRAVEIVPTPEIREGADAVDAGVLPEIDQHDFAPQIGVRQGLRVQPRPTRDLGRLDSPDIGRGGRPRAAHDQQNAGYREDRYSFHAMIQDGASARVKSPLLHQEAYTL